MLVDAVSPLSLLNLSDLHTPPGPEEFSKQVTMGRAARPSTSPCSCNLARRKATACRKNIPLGPHPITATVGGVGAATLVAVEM